MDLSEDDDFRVVSPEEEDLFISPGLGTNITEMQLSSESRLVSLWTLESLLESEPP